MSELRERLSATVEAALLEAGRAAVEAGEASSLSAWVNAALRRQADHDRRMRAMDAFLAEYEAEYGEITDDEIDAARRSAKERAIVVRGKAPTASGRGKRGRGVA